MPSISQIFNLKKTQHELDFVNINPNRDFPVYLNPFVFSSRSDPFSIEASRTIASFFQHNLALIKQEMIDEARANFQHLNEPNETCLGQSRRRPRGRGGGEDNADDLFNSILDSEAMKTGLLEHLEDTAIFIPGIGRDKVSDSVRSIQLAFPNRKMYTTYKALLGKKVIAKGTLFVGMTAHHHTPVLLTVSTLKMAA